MNSWLAFLTAITLNVNGLGDKDKWQELWQGISRPDILCFQETHLCTSLEFAFCLHAQGYDFYFLHGSSASAGVCTAVKYSLGIKVVKLTDVPGCLLALDLTLQNETLRIINVYAPNNPGDRPKFFNQINSYTAGNVMLMGDFNSVTSECDRLSHKLDPTLKSLQSLLTMAQMSEPAGSHLRTFSYHHPSIVDCKVIWIEYISTIWHQECADTVSIIPSLTLIWLGCIWISQLVLGLSLGDSP